MPAPSDAKRHLRIGGSLPDAVTRSHLADGRVVGWYGPPGAVIDAELADQRVPPALAARYGASPEEFWPRWTRTECAAKLADVPITLWLAEHGLDPGPLDVVTTVIDEVVVSVAFPGT
ncbi:hypothetical protein [Actinophytocola gossypii]|uniref:Uncharacterized protein n=1 Tax=Actinophytocola gossypii TaxID=2812003 RepID=A0ABT2JIW8_9PSEU|nr:hypothetical protein [Actinophytocola gossypii]MCT2587184.1 hypothetical protein [Actinophytocola gossypii]